MPYNIILYFRLPYFHVSYCALFFTFYVDVVLTLSIAMYVSFGLILLYPSIGTI